MKHQYAALTRDHAQRLFLDEAHQGKYLKRWEHTLRVAAVGLQIAQSEGFDAQAMTIACLLHDIGYLACQTDEDYQHHGAHSARMARDFLESIGYDACLTEQICYGILIHTEEEADYPRPAKAFELSVSDADNIDRFDAWRMAAILDSVDTSLCQHVCPQGYAPDLDSSNEGGGVFCITSSNPTPTFEV